MGGGGNIVQYSEGDGAVVINNAITLDDPEGTAVTRIELVLAGAGASGETLALPANAKIQANFNNNKLTLTKKAGQDPTNAEYEAALRPCLLYTSPSPRD